MRRACYTLYCSAGVAHLVERHLAKVEVASSSLVARSKKETDLQKQVGFFFGILADYLTCSDGVNPSCAKVLLCKTLVTRGLRAVKPRWTKMRKRAILFKIKIP